MSGSAPYLKKHENGKYYVHWTAKRIGKRISTGATDLVAAKQFFATWLVMEESASAGDPLMADVWALYHEKHVSVNVASVTTATRAWAQMEAFFGSLKVSEVTQDKIDEYVRKRTTGALGRKVKPQTVARELTPMLAAIKFGANKKRGKIDPHLMQKFDLPAGGEPRDRWLREEEIVKLREAAARLRRGKGPTEDRRLSRVERFIWLALETAGREQALLDLTWDRVDFKINTIVPDVPGRKKTKKRRATVPISAALRPVLLRAYAERISDLVLDNKGPVWASVQLVAIEAGLAPKRDGEETEKPKRGQKPKKTGVSPNVFRHTAATHMARRGVSLFKIAKVLGNSIQMVEKVYAKYSTSDLQDAVDLISEDLLEAAE